MADVHNCSRYANFSALSTSSLYTPRLSDNSRQDRDNVLSKRLQSDISGGNGYMRLQGLRLPARQSSSTEALVSDLPLIKTVSNLEEPVVLTPVVARDVSTSPSLSPLSKQCRPTAVLSQQQAPSHETPNRLALPLGQIFETTGDSVGHNVFVDRWEDKVIVPQRQITVQNSPISKERSPVNGINQYSETSSQSSSDVITSNTSSTPSVFVSEVVSVEKYFEVMSTKQQYVSSLKHQPQEESSKQSQPLINCPTLSTPIQPTASLKESAHQHFPSLTDSAFGSSDELDHAPASPRVTKSQPASASVVTITISNRKLSDDTEDDQMSQLSPNSSIDSASHTSSSREMSPLTDRKHTSTSTLTLTPGLNCRNEDGNVDVIFVKNAMGLGFCIEGGMGSLAGDRPISIKKIFGGANMAQHVLQAGDEIIRVNGKDYRQLTQFSAWNHLKSIPDGPVQLTIRRKH